MARRMAGRLDADETAFGNKVKDLAKRAGWLENHTYRSKINGAWRTTTTGIGFPDHLFVKQGRLVVLELKMPGNKPTPQQVEWIELFDSVPGCVARVVWPADWPWIVKALTSRLQTDHVNRATLSADQPKEQLP